MTQYEGVRIDMSCPLRVVRTACESLGLSKRGSKKDNMMRLQKFVQHQTLLATHAASSTLDAEGRREVNVQTKPPCPTPEQIKSHNLTHEPYESRCELCVQFRARQDRHGAVDGSKTSTSLISFDFGYASRSAENVDKAAFLACHDKDTGLIGAIPSPTKGGKHFQFLVTELTRFVVSTGHREIRMRCDGEPATLSILEACRKTCRALGISVSQETTSIGNHQGNGGAERTVEIVRGHASILLSHLESCCEAGKQLFSRAHPIFHWALAHSAWLHNRYKVSLGQTPYERATGRSYSGKIAQFGERVMGFIRQERKSDPKWLPAIWLGKAVNNDAHILAHEGTVFVSRSIRRVPNAFDLKMLGSIETMPCDHGWTARGHRLFQTTKRYVGGGPLPAVGTPDEAGSDPPSDKDDPKPEFLQGSGNTVDVEQQPQAGQSELVHHLNHQQQQQLMQV